MKRNYPYVGKRYIMLTEPERDILDAALLLVQRSIPNAWIDVGGARIDCHAFYERCEQVRLRIVTDREQ